MPQMNPINWLSLFIVFSMIYMLFCILNYFNLFIYFPCKSDSNKSLKNNKNLLNWKW